MKKLSRVLVLVVVLTMALVSCAYAAPIEVTYSSKSAGSAQDLAMDMFAQKLEELSGGRIVGKKYIAGTIGSEEEQAEAVSMGDLGATYASDVMIGNCAGGCLAWLSLPGLVTSYDEAEAFIYSKDGWISKIIDQYMEERMGIKRLAAGDNCFRILATNKPILTPEDLKGVKIRCGNSWTNLQLYERVGTIPVVVASSETLSALEQGIVDGVENGLLSLASSGVQDSVHYILPINMAYSCCSIIVNLDWFNSLSPEDQAICIEAAEIAAKYEIDLTRSEIDALVEKQVSSGKWTMLEMTEDLTNLFLTASDSMWEDARDMYGSDLIDTLLANKTQK